MLANIENLPNDINDLKKIIHDISGKYQNMKTVLTDKEREIKVLTEQKKILEHRLYGTSSEKRAKINIDQLPLFNEAELAEDGFIINEKKSNENEVVIKGYTRRNKGRKPIPEHLPRKEIIHDLSEEEKECKCCKKKRPRIGSEITEEISYIPSKYYVKKHIRYKYGSCSCEESSQKEEPAIITASMPPRLLPGSIASPELLAYIAANKYIDGLPLYRIEKILKRQGIHISRQTMSNWIVRIGSKISDLMEIMFEEIRSGPLIQMDETSVQVLKELDRPAVSKSYMWVTVGYPNNKRIILYHYHQTRSKDVPLALLKDYKGYIQTDGYSAYNEKGKEDGVIHVGCFAHARRKFDEVLKSDSKSESAKWFLNTIKEIYIIEKDLREKLDQKNISIEKFEEERRKQALPVLDRIKDWLDKIASEVPPSISLGKAINYSLSQWPKMIKYLDKWFITPDNNRVENAIRPFVIGRKNWLFCNTPSGAYASAGIYSLIETAKANNLNPFSYLYFLFNELPGIKNKEDLQKLLPTKLKPSDLVKPE